MKTTLTHIIKIMLLPPLWCFRTVAEASRMVGGLDGAGLADINPGVSSRRTVLQVADRSPALRSRAHLGDLSDCSRLAIR